MILVFLLQMQSWKILDWVLLPKSGIFTIENGKTSFLSNNFEIKCLEMILLDNQDLLIVIPIQGDKFHGRFFQTHHNHWLQSDYQWIINKAPMLSSASFLNLFNLFVRRIIEKQVCKKNNRIETHENSSYLLKLSIPKFKEKIG